MKKIISILICVCIFAFSLVACSGSGTAEDKDEILRRFYLADEITVDDPYLIGGYRTAYILVDRETDVCYFMVAADKKYGITVLLDADGKPILREDYND